MRRLSSLSWNLLTNSQGDSPIPTARIRFFRVKRDMMKRRTRKYSYRASIETNARRNPDPTQLTPRHSHFQASTISPSIHHTEMKYLLIGGPADGRREEIPDGLYVLRVPSINRISGITVEEYHKCFFRSGREEFSVFAHQSIPAEDTMRALIEGYHTHESCHATPSLPQ